MSHSNDICLWLAMLAIVALLQLGAIRHIQYKSKESFVLLQLTRIEAMPDSTLKNWLFQRWMGWIVLIIFIILGVIDLIFICLIPRHTLIKAKRDLPAYVIISDRDIDEVKTIRTPPDAIQKKDDAIKHILTAGAKRGTILTESALFAPPQSQQNWRLIAVSSDVQPAAKENITLIGIKGEEAKIVSENAVALGMKDNQLIVALPYADAEKAILYLLADRRLMVLRHLSQ